MQFITIAALLLATAFAAPAQDTGALIFRRANAFCPDGLLYTNPLCCKVDVLGVARLDCQAPPSAPSNCKSFAAICASISKSPACCAVPVAGQALLCATPAGSAK